MDIRARTPDRKIRRGIHELLAIDSSECSVHGSPFRLPGWQWKQPQGHQARCKLHWVYNVDGGWIEDFRITGGRKHDSPVGFQLRINPGKTYVFDRGYCDLSFWPKITKSGSHFVSRLRGYPYLHELQAQAVKKQPGRSGVLHDGFYRPSLQQLEDHGEVLEVTQLRHIIYRDAETGKVFHFITSDLKAAAQTIANIYKRRWAVELLFRWLKGHLDIRRLPVRNSNAVEIQLAAAVLIRLLLQFKKIVTRFSGTPWEMLRKIRTYVYRQTLAACGPTEGCRWGRSPVSLYQVLCE
jgi:hypothetical protein